MFQKKVYASSLFTILLGAFEPHAAVGGSLLCLILFIYHIFKVANVNC